MHVHSRNLSLTQSKRLQTLAVEALALERVLGACLLLSRGARGAGVPPQKRKRFFTELHFSAIESICASIFVLVPLPCGHSRAFSARTPISHASQKPLTRFG